MLDRLLSRLVRASFAVGVTALALVPRISAAATHKPNYTPTVQTAVVANPVFHGRANTMMYTVAATVDDTYSNERHKGAIGVTSTAAGSGMASTTCLASTEYTWSPIEQVFDTRDTRTWTIYNLQPGTAYYYSVRTGESAATYQYYCGALTTAAVPTPTVPATLAALNLTVERLGDYGTKYVMFDTDDCDPHGNHLVAVDADTGNLVWYLDIPAVTGIPDAKIGGWRFQPMGEGSLTSDRILATISAHDHREYLYEFELDGTVVASKDFGKLPNGMDGHLCDGTDNRATGPCPHHDAFKSDLTGQTYVLTAENSNVSTTGNPTWTRARCMSPPYRFIGDGYQTLSEDYSAAVDTSLISDLGYDPAGAFPGPDAPAGCATTPGWQRTLSPGFSWIDWIHTNSLAGTPDGQYLDISLKEFEQIIRVDPDAAGGPSVVWRLASDPAYSDFRTEGDAEDDTGGDTGDDEPVALVLGPDVVLGTSVFSSQHDVHAIDDDTLLLFDNQGNVNSIGKGQSRVLSITFDTTTWSAAVIDRSWALVDDVEPPVGLNCPSNGSGELVPGQTDTVLALCHEEYVIAELNDPSGFPTPPSLYITIPESPAEVCGKTDSTSRYGITGWYRAYPLESLGDF